MLCQELTVRPLDLRTSSSSHRLSSEGQNIDSILVISVGQPIRNSPLPFTGVELTVSVINKYNTSPFYHWCRKNILYFRLRNLVVVQGFDFSNFRIFSFRTLPTNNKKIEDFQLFWYPWEPLKGHTLSPGQALCMSCPRSSYTDSLFKYCSVSRLPLNLAIQYILLFESILAMSKTWGDSRLNVQFEGSLLEHSAQNILVKPCFNYSTHLLYNWIASEVL